MPSQGLNCPSCGRALPPDLDKAGSFKCPHCGAPVRWAFRYLWPTFIVSFVISLVVSQYIGLKAYAGALWIPIFLLTYLMIFLLLNVGSPLEIEPSVLTKKPPWRSDFILFMCFWFALTIYMIVHGLATGWLGFLLGASREEIREGLGLWSIPLGLVNRSFTVTPDKSFIAVLGIIFANCYFWTLGLFFTLKFVHSRVQANRVIELSISGSSVHDEDY